jgi:hypothetical protein
MSTTWAYATIVCRPPSATTGPPSALSRMLSLLRSPSVSRLAVAAEASGPVTPASGFQPWHRRNFCSLRGPLINLLLPTSLTCALWLAVRPPVSKRQTPTVFSIVATAPRPQLGQFLPREGASVHLGPLVSSNLDTRAPAPSWYPRLFGLPLLFWRAGIRVSPVRGLSPPPIHLEARVHGSPSSGPPVAWRHDLVVLRRPPQLVASTTYDGRLPRSCGSRGKLGIA